MTRIPSIHQQRELSQLVAELEANAAQREQLTKRAEALMGRMNDYVEADGSEPAVPRSGDDTETDARSAARALAASRR